MSVSLLDFLAGGLLQAGWGEMLVWLLVVTQLTMMAIARAETEMTARLMQAPEVVG